MRFKLIATGVVMLLVISLCTVSLIFINRTTKEMDDIRIAGLEFADQNDILGAKEQLVKLSAHWSRVEGALEVLTSHDDLHNVTMQLVEASVALECGHMDDFHKAMALLGEAIEHIYHQEQISISNIL